jgi:uracil-DNA glycosylase family 4
MSEVYGPICHEYGIRGYGDPSEGVIIVGIAPGRDEIERSGKPFTGQSGKLLDASLENAGWPRSKVYTTNTICWWNNKPTPIEIERCGPRFRSELLELKPKLIVTAGVIANETVMGRKRPKGSRGSINWSDYWKCYVLDTHHPSAALQAQSMSMVQDIIRDLSKIELALSWPQDGSVSKVEYTNVIDLEMAQSVLDGLPRDDSPVTLDIETSNPDAEEIDAFNDALLCFSLSYHSTRGEEINVVFPKRIFPECVRNGQHTLRWRKEGRCDCGLNEIILKWPLDVHWTFQAGQYDIPALSVYFGQILPLKDDTMLLSYGADERPGQHGLKPLAREYCASGWYEEKVKPFYKGKMHLLEDKVVEEYNAKDSAYDLRLVPILRKKCEEDATYALYRDLLLPAMNTFIRSQIRGINVDQKVLQDLAYSEDGWFRRYIRMQRELQLQAQAEGWPDDALNIDSRPQMAKFLFQILGMEPTKLTKKRKLPAVDKEVLERMDHPFAAGVRAFRTLDTMVDYVFQVMSNLKYDGLLHPSAFVTATRTGRTAYRNPAMQTLPKDYTVGADYARLREIIIPHNPQTHGILESDYNQIEVWLAYFFSGDPVLGEHLKSGDVHSRTAEGAFDTTRDKWSEHDWDVKRQNAKKIRFGLQYGEGAEKLSTPPPVGIGGSAREAQLFINNFWKTYSVHYKWLLSKQREAMEKGYIRTPSGRVMRFPVILDHKQLRQAINAPIQTTASDYNLDSMVRLEPLLVPYNSYIILNVHDALVVEYDLRYEREVAQLVKEVMENPRFGFPSVKVDQKIGPSLGKVKKYTPTPESVLV